MTIQDGIGRVAEQLSLMHLIGDVVVSTDLQLRMDGLIRVRQVEPDDPGVVVHWVDENNNQRCMAIDRYDRVADNLAAIAATLHAMRAIERHGGAEILNRAFTGFTALPGPNTPKPWHVVFDCDPDALSPSVREHYRRLRGERHPDRGGSAAAFAELQAAWASFCAERGLNA